MLQAFYLKKECAFLFSRMFHQNFLNTKTPETRYTAAPISGGHKTFYIFQKVVSVQPCIFLPACSGQEALGVFFTVHFPS